MFFPLSDAADRAGRVLSPLAARRSPARFTLPCRWRERFAATPLLLLPHILSGPVFRAPPHATTINRRMLAADFCRTQLCKILDQPVRGVGAEFLNGVPTCGHRQHPGVDSAAAGDIPRGVAHHQNLLVPQRARQECRPALARDRREAGVVALEDILKLMFGEVKL